MSANLIALLLFVLIANSAMAGIVPNLQDNDQLEPPNNNYTLRNNKIEAKSEEFVEEDEPKEVIVKSRRIESFEVPSGLLIVTYEAGPNSYKYTFELRRFAYVDVRFLKINESGAVREESLELVKPGELIVKGQLIQQYASPSGILTVTYEAGPNGYVAKYTFVSTQGQGIPPLGLSPSALKAVTG